MSEGSGDSLRGPFHFRGAIMTAANGNGNGGVRSDLKNVEVVKDLVEVSILCMFFVQKLGKASAEDVDRKIKEVHGQVNEHLLDQALEGLRARNLLSYARGGNKEGHNIQMYKTTKVKWSQNLEMAHISDLLPALIATEEAKEIIDILNNSEESGKDGVKKVKTKLGYTDYYELLVHFIAKNPILGSQPVSQYLNDLVKKSPYPYPPIEKGQNILRFWRDATTGAVVIPSDVTGGWLRTGLRVGFGLSDSVANYVSVDDIHIMPNKEKGEMVKQVSLPIIDAQTRKGLGIGTYELLDKGTEFSVHFRIPKKGLAEPMKFVSWLVAYAPKPVRGLSPARGKRFGKLEVTGYKLIGESSDISSMLDAVEDDLQDPRAKKLHLELTAKAKQYNMSFKDGKGGSAAEDDSAADPTPD